MGRLHLLRRRWPAIALAAGIGACGGAAWSAAQPPVYAATTELFVGSALRAPAGGEPGAASVAAEPVVGTERVRSYAAVAESPRIAQAVIQRLRLDERSDTVAARLSTENPAGTLLLEVTAHDRDPRRAAVLANAVAAELPRVLDALETPGGQRPVAPVKVTVLRPAHPQAAPVSPRPVLAVALGLLAGALLGAAAAIGRGHSNAYMRRSADVERVAGGRPLGVVPHDREAGRHPLATSALSPARAEAYRTLRTNLQFADVDRTPQVIVVTSALPGEGKTTTACNLALTMALGGARAILIEGDLREPSVGATLGIESTAGLTHVLAGRFTLDDVIIGHQRESLAVLPSGPTPPNPSELLGSRQMADLVRGLRERYDVIVIDAPSLLPVTDAAVLASLADGAVLVVRRGRSKRQQVERAIASLAAVDARLLGTVLNGVSRRQRQREGYGYGWEPRRSAAGAAAASAAPAAPEAQAAEVPANSLARVLAPHQATPGDAGRREPARRVDVREGRRPFPPDQRSPEGQPGVAGRTRG